MVTEDHFPSQASKAQRPPVPPTSPSGLTSRHRPLQTNVGSKHMYTRVRTAALFRAAESCTESKCVSRDEWRPSGRYTQRSGTCPQRARNSDTCSNTERPAGTSRQGRQARRECTAPLPGATRSRQSETDGEMTGGWGRGEQGPVSVWKEKVLEMDGGEGCTAL